MAGFSRSQTEFLPHPLLRSSHLQTVIAAYWSGAAMAYSAQPHVVLLDDGDQMVIHDDCPGCWVPGDRVVVMVHGLGGSHLSGYLVRISAKLKQRGYRTFRVDLRGCGAGGRLAKRPFHAGCSEDIDAVMRFVAKLCPQSPTTLMGFSMGGNIVLKLAGEYGNTPTAGLDSVVAVAPPIDLKYCCNNMSRGVNRLYDRDFVRRLVAHVRRRQAIFPELVPFEFPRRLNSIHEFDTIFTAPRCGFESVDDYYHRASSGPLLAKIQVPAFILAAADDSVVPVDIYSRHAVSSGTEVQITANGGHLGFLTRRKVVPDRRWMDQRVVSWVEDFSQRTAINPPHWLAPPRTDDSRRERGNLVQK